MDIKTLVDIATAVMDKQGYLNDIPEQFIQELCEELHNQFAKYADECDEQKQEQDYFDRWPFEG